jgi:heavy metal sensor kinase
LISIRARLTLWHAAVLTAIVCLFAASALVFVRARLYAELDAQLGRELLTIDRMYREEPYELADLPADRGYLYFHIVEGTSVRHQTDAWKQVGFAGDGRSDPQSWAAPDGTWFRVQGLSKPSYRVAAAVEETTVQHIVRTLGLILVLGIPFATGLAVAGGYFLAGRVLAPIGAIADKAQRITAESLSERLPVGNQRDEFGRLATVFNQALERLQDAFERLRRFTADASHELRTPLTAMRSVGEVALQAPRDSEHYRDVIGSMLEEVDRLTNLADSLLMLTRADSGAIEIHRQATNLASIASAVVEQLHVLAEEKQQVLTVAADPAINAWCDSKLIRLAVANLVHNAIKFTPSGGAVRLCVLGGAQNQSAIEVHDTGPGVPAPHRDRIFERFYRVDAERSSHYGAGLGLAIARWAVEANGGRIEFAAGMGGGALFRIVLPSTESSMRPIR